MHQWWANRLILLMSLSTILKLRILIKPYKITVYFVSKIALIRNLFWQKNKNKIHDTDTGSGSFGVNITVLQPLIPVGDQKSKNSKMISTGCPVQIVQEELGVQKQPSGDHMRQSIYLDRCQTYQYPNAKRQHTVLFARRILRKEFDTSDSGSEHSTAKVTPNRQVPRDSAR